MNAAIESKKAKPERLYQGVGVICGRVTVDTSGDYTIDIEGETFWLRPNRLVRAKLTNHLEAYPDTEVYLRVYPVYSQKLHSFGFSAIKFYANQPLATQINQFRLAGIWQYVPMIFGRVITSIGLKLLL